MESAIQVRDRDVIIKVPTGRSVGSRRTERTLIVTRAAIAAHVGADIEARMDPQHRERLVRHHLSRLFRRAIEISGLAEDADIAIDAPPGSGLPELIYIDAGQF